MGESFFVGTEESFHRMCFAARGEEEIFLSVYSRIRNKEQERNQHR